MFKMPGTSLRLSWERETAAVYDLLNPAQRRWNMVINEKHEEASSIGLFATRFKRTDKLYSQTLESKLCFDVAVNKFL